MEYAATKKITFRASTVSLTKRVELWFLRMFFMLLYLKYTYVVSNEVGWIPCYGSFYTRLVSSFIKGVGLTNFVDASFDLFYFRIWGLFGNLAVSNLAYTACAVLHFLLFNFLVFRTAPGNPGNWEPISRLYRTVPGIWQVKRRK